MSDDLGEIYKVIAWRDYIVSLALDSYIKIWDFDLKLISSHFMTGYNLISLACDQDHLYLGDGDGNVRILDDQLKVKKWLKICEDNISDIRIYGERLIATAYDGTIATVYLKTYEMKRVNVEGQLFEVALLNGKLFVSGTRSYQLDLDLCNIMEIERANHFLEVQGDVYGVSDRLGVFNLTKNISTFEPCDIIAVAGSHIIGASDSGITIYTLS